MRVKLLLCKDDDWLCSQDAYSMYRHCMYLPTYEKYINRIKHLYEDSAVSIWIAFLESRPVGMLALRQDAYGRAEIEGISVREACRGLGVGRFMINEAIHARHLTSLTAQTDADAVAFYHKCGFSIEEKVIAFPDGNVTRYDCIWTRRIEAT